MNKRHRQIAIQEIITAHAIASQEELAEHLRKRGIDATQATLSRDLAEMNVMRIRSGDIFRYAMRSDETEQSIKSLVWKEMLGAEANETVIVIRTLPGRASGVAMFIDSLRHPSVLGTIAGDDTVLVLPASIKKIHTTIRFVRDLLSEKSSA
jgi:transcriptional regulator of arginine metabolism